jgi:hypothetical protein
MTPEQEAAGKRLHEHLKDTPGLVSVGATKDGFVVYVSQRADNVPVWWEGWPVTVSRGHGKVRPA